MHFVSELAVMVIWMYLGRLSNTGRNFPILALQAGTRLLGKLTAWPKVVKGNMNYQKVLISHIQEDS